MPTVYGIKNCDTVKKARKWLDTRQVEYLFHDFRQDGLTKSQLQSWVKQVGWEILLNRRGTTWRKLSEDEKQSINQTRAIALMLEQPTLIKRPVIEVENEVVIGFSEQSYEELFS